MTRPGIISDYSVCSNVFSEQADSIVAMSPEHVTETDLMLLQNGFPVPRIIAINGSLPVVGSMDSFAGFLAAMGYPEEKIRNPLTKGLTYSSYIDSAKLAGIIAWYYEKDSVMPILIGHSQGGMLVVKLLHELSGSFGQDIEVWDPYADVAEGRTTISDPVSGMERPVIGLKVGFASAIATGRVMRMLLGQWNMLKRLRQIPDTADEFTGYHVPNDILSGTIFGINDSDRYYSIGGSTAVRNIVLPENTGHLSIIRIEQLAQDQDLRQWIAAYDPAINTSTSIPVKAGTSPLFAADIWHRIKAAWCSELQHWIKGRRQVCRVVSNDR